MKKATHPHEDDKTANKQPLSDELDANQVADLDVDQFISRQEHEQLMQAKIAEAEENMNRALRMQADLENLRKRMARDQADYRNEALRNIIEKMLPIYDNLERALLSDATSAKAIKEGVQIISRQLLSVMESYGMEKVSAEDCAFDPFCHEAVVTDFDEGMPDNHILEVLQEGYKIGDKLIRPAIVKVNKHN